MSLFAKLFNKNTGEVSSKNVEDFVSLTRVYFQSVIAANLGITNIRNAQIVIKIEGDERYLVCVYSADTSEVFKEYRYDTSPVTQQMYNELESSKEALYQRELSGKEFEQWLDWRKANGAKIETQLLQAP